MTARMVVAHILYYVGLFGFAAYVLLSYVAKRRIAAYIFSRDLQIHSKIIPSPISWLEEILGFALLALVAIGLAIGQLEFTIIIFLAIVYAFLGVLMLSNACKHLVLENDSIFITVFRKQTQYLRSDIRTVEWRNCRGITGKQLAITFDNGKTYSFHMDHFRGVQNVYNELTR